MALIVQKFGGSSVANADRVRNVARIITETYKKGNSVVVVLSAQGDTTDDLIAKAQELNPNASKREMDMLLSTGEQISIALCAMALEAMGLPCVSLTAWQVGIQSTAVHSDARIKKIDYAVLITILSEQDDIGRHKLTQTDRPIARTGNLKGINAVFQTIFKQIPEFCIGPVRFVHHTLTDPFQPFRSLFGKLCHPVRNGFRTSCGRHTGKGDKGVLLSQIIAEAGFHKKKRGRNFRGHAIAFFRSMEGRSIHIDEGTTASCVRISYHTLVPGLRNKLPSFHSGGLVRSFRLGKILPVIQFLNLVPHGVL